MRYYPKSFGEKVESGEMEMIASVHFPHRMRHHYQNGDGEVWYVDVPDWNRNKAEEPVKAKRWEIKDAVDNARYGVDKMNELYSTVSGQIHTITAFAITMPKTTTNYWKRYQYNELSRAYVAYPGEFLDDHPVCLRLAPDGTLYETNDDIFPRLCVPVSSYRLLEILNALWEYREELVERRAATRNSYYTLDKIVRDMESRNA